jgi:hypothetical protein
MRYDLDLVLRLCQEIGLRSDLLISNTLAIQLAEGVRLLFQYAEDADDCLVGWRITAVSG